MKKYLMKWIILIITVSSIIYCTACTANQEKQNTFMKLLSLFPESASSVSGVAIIDYQRIWEINGISLETENGSIHREDLYELISKQGEETNLIGIDALRLGSYYTGWSKWMLLSPIQSNTIGYDFTDVNAEINNIDILPSTIFGPLKKYESQPDESMVAALGNYFPAQTDIAFRDKSAWSCWAIDNYSQEEYKGVDIHNWGDVNLAPIDDPFLPPLGSKEGKYFPLAVSNGQILVANSVDAIREMIECNNNNMKSLADVSEYALLAEGLNELEALAAILADESLANGYPEDESVDTSPKLKHFLTVGTGTGRDENGDYIAIVLTHENSKIAKGNASLLMERIDHTWKDSESKKLSWQETIVNVDIKVKNTLLLAKLYTDNISLWQDWFFNRWPLLLHE